MAALRRARYGDAPGVVPDWLINFIERNYLELTRARAFEDHDINLDDFLFDDEVDDDDDDGDEYGNDDEEIDTYGGANHNFSVWDFDDVDWDPAMLDDLSLISSW